MNRPIVSIITRTKDRRLLFKRAIESVLSQRFQDWELVVVNDGGNREQVDPIIEQYRDALRDRVRVIHHQTSKGMEAASNAGLRTSSGEFVVIHDDDDAWSPDFLEETVGYLRRNASIENLNGVIAHSVRVQEQLSQDTVIPISEEPFNPDLRSISLYRMAAANLFPPISFLFRRSVFDEIGYYREDLPVLGDWEFHLRFVARYEIAVIPKPLAYYHHRVTLMDGPYSNTVIGGNDLHRYYDTVLRNELLRQDLESGKVGLGFLVNVARSYEDVRTSIQNHLAPIPPPPAAPTLFSYVKDKVYNAGIRAGFIKR